MAEETTDQAAANAQAPEQQFIIERIYVKDISFESPNSPAIFAGDWQPVRTCRLKKRWLPVPL